MAASVLLADTSFLIALLDARDRHHAWAAADAEMHGPPWHTCEAVLSEAFFLLSRTGSPTALAALLQRGSLLVSFDLARELEPVLLLIRKYSGVPMSLADACLVRMTELHARPLLLTTDTDFRVYRRHGRQIVPCIMPA